MHVQKVCPLMSLELLSLNLYFSFKNMRSENLPNYRAQFFPKIRKTYQKFHNLLEKRNPPPHFHLRFSMCVHELLSNLHFCNQKVFEKSFLWLLRTSEDDICSSVEFLPKMNHSNSVKYWT